VFSPEARHVLRAEVLPRRVAVVCAAAQRDLRCPVAARVRERHPMMELERVSRAATSPVRCHERALLAVA
jgi:hypothetical protein